MSADNWTQCPRCLKRRAMEIENKQTKLDASYGKVPLDRFDSMRAELETLKSDPVKETFREDYEFHGASDGEVEAVYSGSCGTCNLRTSFKHVHNIDVNCAS